MRDPGALLPGGFWAAVAVWLERPQVANKRLCGVRLEARRSVALPRAAAGPRPRSPGEGLGPGQTTGPARGTAIRGPGESQPRHGQRENRKEAAAVARLAGGFGPAGEAGVGESDSPASDLDSLWDAFFQSLDGGLPELLAFLSGPAAGSQPEAPSELSVVLRTLIPKTGPRCPLAVPRRELVVQGRRLSRGDGRNEGGGNSPKRDFSAGSWNLGSSPRRREAGRGTHLQVRADTVLAALGEAWVILGLQP